MYGLKQRTCMPQFVCSIQSRNAQVKKIKPSQQYSPMHNGQVHIYLIVKCNRVTKSMSEEFILRVFLTKSVDNFFTFSHSSQATLRNSTRISLCKRKIYQIILKNAVAIVAIGQDVLKIQAFGGFFRESSSHHYGE